MANKPTKKAAEKKADAPKDDAQDSSKEGVPERDLATSGRDAQMAAEDAEPGEEDSELRQAQADAATGGAAGKASEALTGPTTASLNPAFYPQPE